MNTKVKIVLNIFARIIALNSGTYNCFKNKSETRDKQLNQEIVDISRVLTCKVSYICI
jgi:hypothetical protein